MPRQIDLFPQNLQVNNDPTNRMGVTAAQINHLQDQIPAAQAKAQEVAINAMLTALDSVTGLDLVGWWKDTQDLLNLISASQQQSWLNFQNFLNGLTQQTDADVAGALEWIQTQFNQLSASLQQSWLSFQNLINSVVGGVDKDVNDLIIALNSTGADAATATANWDTLFLDLGFSVTDAASLASWLGGTNTTAVNGSSWSTKITNDLAILLDVFHVTYQAGATGDAPGTLGTNGKPTWYSAWNDILALLGIVNSTSTPSIPAPTIGSAITTAQSTASTAQTTLNTTNTNLFGSTTPGTAIQTAAVPSGIPATKIANVLGGSNLGADVSSVSTTASNGTSWSTRLTNDLLITSDVFHTVYQAGSPTDTPTTLGTNGKRTWYSAWNDLLALAGVVNSTTAPTDAAPTVGTAINNAQSTANTAQTTLNTTNTNLFGSTTPASTITTSAVPSGIPATKISNVLGGANLGADVTAANAAAGTAQSGVTAANANANAALNQLTAIPAQTVVPNLMAGAASVTFGNAGTGGSATNPNGSVSTPLSCTGTQTIGSTASVMIAAVTFSLVGSGSLGNAQVSIGGQQMQGVSSSVQISSVTEFIQYFILWNPPVGTNQTVTATAYGIGGAGVGSVSFESASYVGATTVSTPITNSGTGTALTLSVPAAVAGTLAVAAFSAGDVVTKADTTLSAFTKTQRGNVTVGVNTLQYGYQSLVFGDTAGGAGGVTFGATGADSSAGWVGIGLILSAKSVIGSGLRLQRTATATGSPSSGNQTLGTGFYDTTPQYLTSDLSISGTTGAATVTVAGWYMVTISQLEASATTIHQARVLLYQNGAVVQQGQTMYVTTTASNTWIMQSTFTVYCSAGDTIQPGVWYSTAPGFVLTGEATGTCTYWEVALMNRSLL